MIHLCSCGFATDDDEWFRGQHQPVSRANTTTLLR
jgi:hypothetical protein